MKKVDRRNFIKQSAAASAGLTLMMSSAHSWAFAPNETVNFAMLGTGGRSYALMKALSFTKNAKLLYACDVDQVRLDAFLLEANKTLGYSCKGEKDFRKLLQNKDIDAVFIATPEHWHAPMAIMALEAGKHVYVEKPCSDNLHENELLLAAQIKYNKVCQMGNQQRRQELLLKL